jgi:hypothetical protein
MTGFKKGPAVSLLALVIALGWIRVDLPSDVSLDHLMPAGRETAGWRPSGRLEVFNSETLFDYIDGGAEIYLEYGFRRLAVRDYRNDVGASIVIEIFEMQSSPSAFGMYTFKSASSGRETTFGQDGQLADYYLNFWKGNFLVTLTGSDEKPTTIRGLQDLGEAVAARIPTKGEVPGSVSLLPGKGRAAGLKYFLGPLGVGNSYVFFPEDVFGVKEAVKSDYRNAEAYSLYLFLYKSPEEGRATFAAVEKAFRQSDRYTGFTVMGEGRFRLRDAKGRAVMVLASCSFILASVGAENLTIIEEAAAAVMAGQESKQAK